MKHPANTSNPIRHAQLRVYMLALLLATFIAALHAGILFGLADLLMVLRQWAQAAVAERPADILVVVAAICVYSQRTSGRLRYGRPFSGSRVTYPRSPTVGISPELHTQLSGTVTWCSRSRGEASVRSRRSMDCLPSDVRPPSSSWCCKTSGNTRCEPGRWRSPGAKMAPLTPPLSPRRARARFWT